jgi:hypothetical protein
MSLSMMKKKIGAISILLLTLAHLDCTYANSVERHCASVGYEFFYDIARAQSEFTTFPLEKKYDVLICASQGTHPPRLEFASLFAAEAKAGAVLLKRHLAEGSDDMTIRDIAYALLRMQELETYNVRADSQLMATLKLRIDGMKNVMWRDVALENFKRLRDGSGNRNLQ